MRELAEILARLQASPNALPELNEWLRRVGPAMLLSAADVLDHTNAVMCEYEYIMRSRRVTLSPDGTRAVAMVRNGVQHVDYMETCL